MALRQPSEQRMFCDIGEADRSLLSHDRAQQPVRARRPAQHRRGILRHAGRDPRLERSIAISPTADGGVTRADHRARLIRDGLKDRIGIGLGGDRSGNGDAGADDGFQLRAESRDPLRLLVRCATTCLGEPDVPPSSENDQSGRQEAQQRAQQLEREAGSGRLPAVSGNGDTEPVLLLGVERRQLRNASVHLRGGGQQVCPEGLRSTPPVARAHERRERGQALLEGTHLPFDVRVEDLL